MFPESQSAQCSILALLIYLAGPILGVKTTFFAHAWIGFIGTYVLRRRSFKLRVDSSVVAAKLFMFNSFYAYRSIVSHLFFGLMLIPSLAWLLLEASASRKWWDAIVNATATGLVFAIYMVVG